MTGDEPVSWDGYATEHAITHLHFCLVDAVAPVRHRASQPPWRPARPALPLAGMNG